MKITFVCVGGLKKAYIREGFQDYLKRIKRYSSCSVVEVREEPATAKTREESLKKEASRIISKLARGDFLVVLGEKGKIFTSAGFSGFLRDLISGGKKGVVFVVGGPYGLHPSVYERADMVMALSSMTLPHELARLVAAEQVYRAFTIMRNEPYSH